MISMAVENSAYIGRFAPSPSGALHFGSLIAALASYLDARTCGGRWLLRMEDLDPAREPVGAADSILFTLEKFGLHWDGAVVYQSQRLEAYAEALQTLKQLGLIYPCDCSRQRIRAIGGIYDNACRERKTPPPGDSALRIQVPEQIIEFEDRIQGRCQESLKEQCGDFVLRRRDGLFAYQLAVVVDDAWQGVTDVVRGHDLLESTARQIYLQRLLNTATPAYAHVPVATNTQGQKLSKQHFANPIKHRQCGWYLVEALQFLGQRVPKELLCAPAEQILDWAQMHWDIQAVPKLANIPISRQLS
jgi:glutamyl-Q tRNA(Asp) synthetase